MTAAAALAQTPSAPCSELQLQLNKLIASGPLDQSNPTATALLQCVERNEMTPGRKALLMSQTAGSGFCVDGGTKRRLLWRALGMVRDQPGPEKAELLAYIGTMRLHNGDLKHAERMLRASLELQRRVGGYGGTNEILRSQPGITVGVAKAVPEATRVLNQALERADSLSEAAKAALILNSLAVVHERCGRPELARPSYGAHWHLRSRSPGWSAGGWRGRCKIWARSREDVVTSARPSACRLERQAWLWKCSARTIQVLRLI